MFTIWNTYKSDAFFCAALVTANNAINGNKTRENYEKQDEKIEKTNAKNWDDTHEWMFTEIMQNTALNSARNTFVYSKPTFLGLPITEIKALIENFPGIEKAFPASWNSHSNSRNENWTLSIFLFLCNNRK